MSALDSQACAGAITPLGAGLVALTGVTGALGSSVSEILAERGLSHRQIVRDPSRLRRAGEDVRVADYRDRARMLSALEGVQTLFMVSAHEGAKRMSAHRELIAAARDAGVAHVVYTSFLNAAPDAVFSLAREYFGTEELIRESGMEFTFLRDSFYAEFLPNLATDGVIRGPAGDGRVSAVARTDVALAAAAILLDPAPHRAQSYDLTGPAAPTLTEVAELLEQTLGRSVRYENESVEDAYVGRRALSSESWQLDAWVSTYTAIAAGELATVSDDILRLPGRAPCGVEEALRCAPRDG